MAAMLRAEGIVAGRLQPTSEANSRRAHPRADLSHVNVAFLYGSKEGNYYASVDEAAKQASHSRGRIVNIASAG